MATLLVLGAVLALPAILVLGTLFVLGSAVAAVADAAASGIVRERSAGPA